VLLAVGVPFVVNILREEQQQRNLETPPVQTRCACCAIKAA
jgi:hypothetical protein